MVFETIGNPNIYMWNSMRTTSVENLDLRYQGYQNSATGNTTTGGETVMIDLTEIKTWTIKQTVIDFQVPTINVDFMVNGLVYFTHTHTNNDLTIKNFDFSVINGNFGTPPLILDKGETWGWRIQDGNRLNNTDRVAFVQALWGIRIGV